MYTTRWSTSKPGSSCMVVTGETTCRDWVSKCRQRAHKQSITS